LEPVKTLKPTGLQTVQFLVWFLKTRFLVSKKTKNWPNLANASFCLPTTFLNGRWWALTRKNYIIVLKKPIFKHHHPFFEETRF
jgi:hypothetical protein